MVRRVAVLAALALGAAPAVAHARKPFLSMGRAEAAMARDAAIDRPVSISIARCHRASRMSIACWVTETGATNVLSDDGAVTPVDVSWTTSARLSRGRVLVTLL